MWSDVKNWTPGLPVVVIERWVSAKKAHIGVGVEGRTTSVRMDGVE
jgi:hypothetical protein